MTTKLSTTDLASMTKDEVYAALDSGKVDWPTAKPRIDAIDREEQTAAYRVTIGKTGRFYIAGPDCSQSLHAGQVLGILSVKDKIVAYAKQHASAKSRTETLKNSKGEEYAAVFQGDVNCGKSADVLKALAAL